MPYVKEEETLEQLITMALENKEIEDGAKKAGVSKIFLATNLKKKANEIWNKGAKEIEVVNELEKTLNSSLEELEKIMRLRPSLWSSLSRFLLLLGLPIIVINILINAVYIYLNNWKIWTAHVGFFISIFIVSEFIPMIIFSTIFYRRASSEWQKQYRQVNISLGLAALRNRVEEAKKAVSQTVLDKGIMPELRSMINIQLRPSYDTILTTLSSPGLAEVFDPIYEITTEPKNKLLRLLNNMPGGSIGIAGPRGAGKTTLIWSLCMPSSLEIKGRPVLSVMLPAPVEYDARDFILHIFSSLCHRVLKLKNVSTRSPWEAVKELQDPLDQKQLSGLLSQLLGLRGLLLISVVLGYIGFLLLMFGIIALILTVPPTNSTSRSVSTTTYASSTPSRSTTISTTTTAPSSPTKSSNELISTLLTELDLQPGPSMLWGFILVGLGYAGYFQTMKLRRMQRAQKEELNKLTISTDAVAQEALLWLDQIRFQQSYSSGWSGTLRLPIAVEGALNTAVSLAQNQLSLPEIIDRYRDFLQLLSSEYEIIIGIDELDKLESDEKAQQFLNEIKALFGLEHCFYLISVSESAMSNFERRGLPIRDTFDSSFDAIVNVDYLNLKTANDLLRRRVIGLPIPFLCFCYCMSGGLARDLIRVCRDLLEHLQVCPNENNLAELCNFLIKSDISMKLRAASYAAKKIIPQPEVNLLFDKLLKFEIAMQSSLALLKAITDFFDSMNQIFSQQTPLNGDTEESEQWRSLYFELGVYLYYSVTLLDFFCTGQISATWQNIEGSGELDILTRARQYITLSPQAASSIISDFRKTHNMEVFKAEIAR